MSPSHDGLERRRRLSTLVRPSHAIRYIPTGFDPSVLGWRAESGVFTGKADCRRLGRSLERCHSVEIESRKGKFVMSSIGEAKQRIAAASESADEAKTAMANASTSIDEALESL